MCDGLSVRICCAEAPFGASLLTAICHALLVETWYLVAGKNGPNTLTLRRPIRSASARYNVLAHLSIQGRHVFLLMDALISIIFVLGSPTDDFINRNNKIHRKFMIRSLNSNPFSSSFFSSLRVQYTRHKSLLLLLLPLLSSSSFYSVAVGILA